ncbi:MAG: tetratricopeptide repeat protein [Anaerolineales bacterium]
MPTNTPGPSPTYTLTPTSINATGLPPVINTGKALEGAFNVNYTPTPLYVNTPRPPQSSDIYRAMKPAYEKGDWDEVIRLANEIIKAEPEAADIYYYMGEAYRFKGDPGSSETAYSNALALNSQFGAAYVGLARARLLADPNANVLPLLVEAVRLDPNFGEAFLERAKVKIRDNDVSGALQDLGEANKLMPNSPLVFYYTALAQQKQNVPDRALQAAEKSLTLDITYLPTYLLLGQLYAETGNDVEASRALAVYLKYEEGDASAYLLLGKMHFKKGEYEETIQQMDKALSLDRNRREANLYRFLSNVELGNADESDRDIDQVIANYSDRFDASLGIIRGHYMNERYGSAELTVSKTEALAKTDEQKALTYYWAALVYEKRNNPKKAVEYWKKLLELPEDAMTAEMRTEAEGRLAKLVTPTPTAKQGSKTATPTRTPTPARTPSKTPTK